MVAVDEIELQKFAPLKRLSMDALHELTGKTPIIEAPKGKVLFRLRDRRPYYYFLLDGTIELQQSDGRVVNVTAGEEASTTAVGANLSGEITATALSPVRYFSVDADLLSVLNQSAEPEDYAIDELHADDDDPDNRLLFRIYQDYIDDKLEIPQVPEISLRVRKAIENPDVDIPKVARIIQADPALVARLVRVANSALYTGVSPVGNIRNALVRLGLSVTRDLAMSFTVQNMFKSEHRLVRQRILKVWQHSTMVAAVSFTLARLTRLYEPEHALLAGLLHDIGAATILQQADACTALSEDREGLEHVLDRLRGEVGGMVLDKWGFPDDLVNVARDSHHWYRDGSAAHDLCDLVIVAKVHCLAIDPTSVDIPSLDTLPAYRKLGLGLLTESQQLKVLEDAKNEIAEMRRLLLA